MTTSISFKTLNIDNEGFHLILKIYINNKVAKVVLDTGASKTVFDNHRVRKYLNHSDFESNDKLSTGLGTNSMQSHTTSIKKLKIGDLEITNYKTVLLDLSHVNHSYEQIGFDPIDGVLGSDILVEYKAIIDYEKKVLKLKHNKSKK